MEHKVNNLFNFIPINLSQENYETNEPQQELFMSIYLFTINVTNLMFFFIKRRVKA